MKTVHRLGLLYLTIILLVALPFILWSDFFESGALSLIDNRSPAEVFAVTSFLLTADIFIPVPSSALSVTCGMLLGQGLAFVAILSGLTGSCLVGYGFGYYFRRIHLNRWYEDNEFQHLSRQLSKYGFLVLLAFRGIPLLAETSVIVAGFHRYPLLKFLAVVIPANMVLAALFSFLGQSALNLTSVYLVIASFVIVPVLTLGVRLWWIERINQPA